MDVAFVRDQGVNVCLAVDAAGGGDWVKAAWEVPGGSALYRILKLSSFGPRVARWFTQVDPASRDLHPRYRWSHRLVRGVSIAVGAPLPGPIHAPLDDPLPVARWMASEVRRGRTPWIRTFPSSAVRACQAALDAGIELDGARFTVAGEPVTAAKLDAIRRSGARAAPRYGTIETGSLAWGCLAPAGPDDMHVFHDLHAIVQPGDSSLLFVTSLRRTAPLVMLNLSMGDQATLGPRACGCPLERLGWTTHVRSVLSREKLTAGGMTFYDVDVVKVLEHVLPAAVRRRADGLPARRGGDGGGRARGAAPGPSRGRAARFRARRRGVPGRDRRALGRRAHHGRRSGGAPGSSGWSGGRPCRPPRARSCTSTSTAAARRPRERPGRRGGADQKRRVARTIVVAWTLLAACASMPGRRLRVRS